MKRGDLAREIAGFFIMLWGIIFVCVGAAYQERQNLVVAGAILVAAAYLGDVWKNSSATEQKPTAKDWPRLQ